MPVVPQALFLSLRSPQRTSLEAPHIVIEQQHIVGVKGKIEFVKKIICLKDKSVFLAHEVL
jgi:hypothetical protein